MSESQAVELTLYTRETNLIILDSLASGVEPYSHRRVIGISLEEDRLGSDQGDVLGLALPYSTAIRLLACASDALRSRRMNCHRFARVMTGLAPTSYMEEGDRIEPYSHFDAPEVDIDTQVAVPAIELGKAGVVGISYPPDMTPIQLSKRIPHSVVGLGHETPQSLHFTGFGGMLSVADNADLLEFYGNCLAHYKPVEVGLYQLHPRAYVPSISN